MRMKGVEIEVSFEVRKGKKVIFAAVSSHEINKIPECKMGTVGKILDKGMRPL